MAPVWDARPFPLSPETTGFSSQEHLSSLPFPPVWVENRSPPDLWGLMRGLFPTQNLLEIVVLQTRAKYLQAVVDGKYVLLHRNRKSLLLERKRLNIRLVQLNTVLSQVQEDYPQYQEVLRKVQQKIASKLEPPELS